MNGPPPKSVARSASPQLSAAISRPRWIKWLIGLRLIRRRTVWCPTSLGSISVAMMMIVPLTWWFNCGESYLSVTRPVPAEFLVLEGWIGREGIRAAATEFKRGGYQYIVSTGGLTSGVWEDQRISYATMAERELMLAGVANDAIIVAPARDSERQRTYESALAALRALQAKGFHPQAINLFTKGPHARRSCLVFAKVFGPGTKVGILSWSPLNQGTIPWWRSSERAKDLLTETAGYVFEALLNSGRGSDHAREAAPPGFVLKTY
jgi:uncharacterized SAM-binding protein YcdF (DUF218 family)